MVPFEYTQVPVNVGLSMTYRCSTDRRRGGDRGRSTFLIAFAFQDRLQHVFDREPVALTLFRRLGGEPNSAGHDEPFDPNEDVHARILRLSWPGVFKGLPGRSGITKIARFPGAGGGAGGRAPAPPRRPMNARPPRSVAQLVVLVVLVREFPGHGPGLEHCVDDALVIGVGQVVEDLPGFSRTDPRHSLNRCQQQGLVGPP